MAHNGFLSMPEIQFLTYVHNAEDQIRGEAATLSFFSNGQYTNPMVIRIAGLGYQKGFGGHFHNDKSEEHTSELQSLMRISYAVFCLKKKKQETKIQKQHSGIKTTI